jgi:predicted nucleotidyltransferase
VLQELFSSQARVAILGLFLLNPSDRFYMREVAARSGQPIRAVQRELTRLETAGLFSHIMDGNRKYYQINKNYPIFPELKAIFLKTFALGDTLRQHLLRVKKDIIVAFIYGSYAKAQETATSDIDLFVVGDITASELSKVLSPAKEGLRREINAVAMPPQELKAKVRAQNHFVLSILSEPKLFLVGDKDDIESITG